MTKKILGFQPVLFRTRMTKNLVLRNEIFLFKPTSLVYHHAESVYIVTPFGVHKSCRLDDMEFLAELIRRRIHLKISGIFVDSIYTLLVNR